MEMAVKVRKSILRREKDGHEEERSGRKFRCEEKGRGGNEQPLNWEEKGNTSRVCLSLLLLVSTYILFFSFFQFFFLRVVSGWIRNWHEIDMQLNCGLYGFSSKLTHFFSVKFSSTWFQLAPFFFSILTHNFHVNFDSYYHVIIRIDVPSLPYRQNPL